VCCTACHAVTLSSRVKTDRTQVTAIIFQRNRVVLKSNVEINTLASILRPHGRSRGVDRQA